MAYPAIGIVDELLADWFSAIASWTPSAEPSHPGCTSCTDSVVARAMGITDWPHDLVHLIVTHTETMIEVARELSPGNAEQRVLSLLTANASDAHDIFDSCVAQPLTSYLGTEVELLIESLRLPA